MFWSSSCLVSKIIQSLHFRGDELSIEQFGFGQSRAEHFSIIVSHCLRIDPECLLQPSKRFFILEIGPIKKRVKILMIHPLAAFVERPLDLHTRIPSIFALKQDVAISNIAVAHLDHLL